MTQRAERATIAPGGYAAGRSKVGWAGTILAVIAVLVAVVGLLLGPNWTLLWAAFVLLVLAVATGSVLRRLGFGQS